jgi:hypothetical protein
MLVNKNTRTDTGEQEYQERCWRTRILGKILVNKSTRKDAGEQEYYRTDAGEQEYQERCW